MLLAFGLMGLILFGSNWAYHKMGLIPNEPASATKSTAAPVTSKAMPLPNSAPGSLPGDTTNPGE
ncbi:MAG TPA: hypothetical protein VHX39_37310, partial [Acetobacteraceae bacterium]|nr:hypothetical protein [Acetobacteraceae bacterium]